MEQLELMPPERDYRCEGCGVKATGTPSLLPAGWTTLSFENDSGRRLAGGMPPDRLYCTACKKHRCTSLPEEVRGFIDHYFPNEKGR